MTYLEETHFNPVRTYQSFQKVFIEVRGDVDLLEIFRLITHIFTKKSDGIHEKKL